MTTAELHEIPDNPQTVNAVKTIITTATKNDVLPIDKIQRCEYVWSACLLCDETIDKAPCPPHTIKFGLCDDCRTLWKKLKEGANDDGN